jgi:hypothetical protein
MKYHDEKQYAINAEFNSITSDLVQKYPGKFKSINMDKVCGVIWITNEKSHTETVWMLQRVRMPMALHCPCDWYVIFRSADWNSWDEKKKLIIILDVLNALRDTH